MCFHHTGMKRRHVMDNRDYAELQELLGFPVHLEGGSGRMARHVAEQARMRCLPLDETQRLLRAHVNPYQVREYAKTLEAYKLAHGLFDYTDMLERGARAGSLDVDVMIVDEAQDLTDLQWRVVRALTPDHADVYWAGDDDQTIHEWAGASLDAFQRLGDEADEVIVLDKSYRLPRAIFDFAAGLIGRVSRRYAKEWRPHAEGGCVKTVASYAMQNLPVKEGSWLLLGRNRHDLPVFEELLRKQGVPYFLNGKLVNDNYLNVIVNWEKMRHGEKLNARQVNQIYRLGLGLPATAQKGLKYGIKDMPTDAVWYEALDRIPSRVVSFIRKARAAGEDIRNPRVRVSTIHGCKGMEAEHVACLSDISPKSVDTMLMKPDEEHRVFYVAATRAKQSLYLIGPQGGNHYRWH